MIKYRAELEMMGNHIPDNQFKQHILGSLPLSWDQWINNTIGSVVDIANIPMPLGQLIMHIRNEAKRCAGRSRMTARPITLAALAHQRSTRSDQYPKGAHAPFAAVTTTSTPTVVSMGNPNVGSAENSTTPQKIVGVEKGKERDASA